MPSLSALQTRPKNKDDITPQAAAAEVLRRRAARTSLIQFAQYVDPLYIADPFHIDVAAALDRVVAGEIRKLMIFAPPQHGKSKLVSEDLPAYWLGRRPNDPVIITSYGGDLATSKSREARTIVQGDEYRALFGDLGAHSVEPNIDPVEMSNDGRSVEQWHLAAPHRGKVRAVGVGGPLTGFPATLGIIDDPVKDLSEARSFAVRQSTWGWYETVFLSRIADGGAIVIIMTRWDEDDLAGRLIALEGHKWTILRYPALAETQEVRDKNNKTLKLPAGLPDLLNRKPGEPLAPHRFSQETLLEKQSSMTALNVAALHDGVPRKAEGNRFKRHWFEYVDAAPRRAKRVRYWDKAATKKKENDGADGAATAGVLISKTDDGLYYVEDSIQEWVSSLEREKIIKDTAERDAKRYGGKSSVKIYVEQEPGSAGKDSTDATIRNLSGFPIYKDLPSGDKDVRLDPFEAQCQAGNVFLVRGDWNESWLDELTSIPNGKRRDQGDASSGAFNRLNDGAAAPPKRMGYGGLRSRAGRGRR